MKKFLFLFCGMLCGMCAREAYADTYSQGTSSITAVYQNGVKLATGNIVVELMEVMTAGGVDSAICLYDGAVSSNTALKKYESWQGSTARTIGDDIEFSSGVFYSNLGTQPAVLRIKYRRISKY